MLCYSLHQAGIEYIPSYHENHVVLSSLTPASFPSAQHRSWHVETKLEVVFLLPTLCTHTYITMTLCKLAHIFLSTVPLQLTRRHMLIQSVLIQFLIFFCWHKLITHLQLSPIGGPYHLSQCDCC